MSFNIESIFSEKEAKNMPILFKKNNGEITPFHNAEYISAFYFISKSILDKCEEEINSIPRNPRK